MTVETLEAVRKSVVVAAPVARAWEVFVGRLTDWWPLATHSIGGDETVTALVDSERIYERTSDGTEHTWGRVSIWEPPTRLAFTWEVHRDAETFVDVRFIGEGAQTRVELVHSGFHALAARDGYDRGWGDVLARYEEAVRA